MVSNCFDDSIISMLESQQEDHYIADIVNWMRSNISYDDQADWKLKTTSQLERTKCGNCHDQSYYIFMKLKEMGIPCKQLFFIEYRNDTNIGGMTHTLTYYHHDGTYYWIETAWDSAVGIHKYDTLSNMKKDIIRRWRELDTGYDDIAFFTKPSYHTGMTLAEYVSSWK